MATDIGYALPGMFVRAGLREVDYDLVGRIETGGDTWAQMFQITTSHIAAPLLASGVLTEDEIADQRHALDDPSFQFLGYLNIAVWGRQAAE